MTRLGFLLDSDSCIGCHACTIACKSEHDVPLGVNRTWVKYIETGSFPNASRKFSVMRCNQCDDAPCMTICPTNALFRADNGIVDFQDDNCIGCKSCMNACPYDALYINPETNTAQKCNFCNHRVEVDLAPSCVVVCPTEAIKVVDFDDPEDPVGRLIGREDVAVRTPEQNTKPKVYYKGADQASLDPTRTKIAADGMIWADTTENHRQLPVLDEHGYGDAGVTARTTYTTSHETTWDRMVSGYLVTKAVAGGVMMMAALMVVLGHAHEQAAVGVVPPMVAGVFLAITGALLIGDLKQPGRFFYLLTKSNFDSWLVKGAYVPRRIRRRVGDLVGARARRRRRCVEVRRDPSGAARRGDRRVHGVPVRPMRRPRPVADAVVVAVVAGASGRGGRIDVRDPRRFHGHPVLPGRVVDAARGSGRRWFPHLGRTAEPRQPPRRTRHRVDDDRGSQAVVPSRRHPRGRRPDRLRRSGSRRRHHQRSARRTRWPVRPRRHVALRNRLRPRRPIRPPLLSVRYGPGP